MRTSSLRHFLLSAVSFGSAGLLYGCSAGNAAPPAIVPASRASVPFALPGNVRAVCPDFDASATPHCEAFVRTDGSSNYGYVPSDLQSAYNLPSTTRGNGQTVAVIELLDDPNVEGDLFTYRNTFGLPVCSTLNGCFSRVNQKGVAGHYPPPNTNNSIETSLDLDMVSAACPNCKILLVEGAKDSWASLAASVNEAVKLGATIVSISYGGSNPKVNPTDYDHPGVVLLAAGGDSGYLGHKDQVPAGFPTVVSVGGTTLVRGGSGRGWSESVWGGTGSGCSSFPKPQWQTDTGCATRTTNDIAAVADPRTGVAVYDSYNQSGWMEIGGTSASTPINAAVFALAGNASQVDAAQPFYQTANQAYLYDITAGADGRCSHKDQYLCSGEIGYDGPTGWGTPNGTGAY